MNILSPKTKTVADVAVDVVAVCHRCRLRHPIRCGADRWAAETADWHRKHAAVNGCRVEFTSPRRRVPGGLVDWIYEKLNVTPWFMAYGENANFNFSYRTATAGNLTNAVTSLGSSSTWLAGYASATIDNSTNADLDVLVTAKVTVGTTPTTNTVIEIDSVTMLDDANWPDTFTGSTGAVTITSTGVKGGLAVPLEFLNVDSTTSNRAYHMTDRSLAALYGGMCPKKSCLFTAHNTGVALNATAGNHSFTTKSVYIVGA